MFEPVDLHFEVVDPALPAVSAVDQITFFGVEYRNTTDMDGSGTLSPGDTASIDGAFAVTSFLRNGSIVFPPGFLGTWEMTGTYVGLQDVLIPLGDLSYAAVPGLGVLTLYVSTDMTQQAATGTGLGYTDGTVVAQFIVASGGGVYRIVAPFDGARDLVLTRQSSLAGFFDPEIAAASFDGNLDADPDNNNVGGDVPQPSSWPFPNVGVNFPWSYFVLVDGSLRFGNPPPACGDGIVDVALGEECDDGNLDNFDGCRNDCTLPFCGDGIVDPGEVCDDGNLDDTDGCRSDCTVPLCGDGIVDAAQGEECDDGNLDNTDGCRNDCTIARCGDGILDPGEACDDGNTDNTDGCRNDCTVPVCGDGIVDAGEACDDGNQDNTDGCRNDCTVPVCGDGIVDLAQGEECDDGNLIDTDGCRNNCTIPVCGDGIADAGEECDDGNRIDTDGCRNNCTVPVCGDGIVDASEACDDGNQIDTDGCRNDCTLPFCGDGFLDPGEQCDDGNQIDTDGCRNNCTIPVCGDGIVDAGEACDDGNQDNTDGCRNDCTLPFCGDGIVDAGEACDDGNQDNTDGCRNDCTIATCGDGIVDAGEQCDDGNANNLDGCRNDCTVPICGDGIMDAGEACDDGNSDNFDGCRNDCTLPFCGDGILDAGETCDDGNNLDGDGCSATCTVEGCDLVVVKTVSPEVVDCTPTGPGDGGEACGCDGKVSELTLRYNGAEAAFVSVQQKRDGQVVFSAMVAPSEIFTFLGKDKKWTLGTEILIFVNGELHTKIHTSCSQPIGPGLISGDFEVIDGKSRNGGKLCPITGKGDVADSDSDSGEDGNGDGDSDSEDGYGDSDSDSGEDSNHDGDSDSEAVAEDSDSDSGNDTDHDGDSDSEELGASHCGAADSDSGEDGNGDGDSDSEAGYGDSDSDSGEDSNHDGDSDSEAAAGDSDSDSGEDGDHDGDSDSEAAGGDDCTPPPPVCDSQNVTYTYTVTNNGPDLTDVQVVDDKLGVIAVIPALAHGQSHQVTVTASICETTTNTVTVTGNLVTGAVCEASDTATVTCSETPPPEECGCEGKVTSLTLRYLGDSPATVKVVQKRDGQVVFDDMVAPGELFTFIGMDRHDTLGTEVKVYVNGTLHTKIHTSCSEPIGPGLVRGDFEVVDGASRGFAALCPVSSPCPSDGGGAVDSDSDSGEDGDGDGDSDSEAAAGDSDSDSGEDSNHDGDSDSEDGIDNPCGDSDSDSGEDGDLDGDSDSEEGLADVPDEGTYGGETGTCDGKVSKLTLRYHGKTAAFVECREGKRGKSLFRGALRPGEVITLSDDGKRGMGDEVTVLLEGKFHTKLDTSCKKPIGSGLKRGHFEVIDGYSKKGGRLGPME